MNKLIWICALALPATGVHAADWPAGRVYELKGMKVSVSAPVLVQRDYEPFCYPRLERLANGQIICAATIDSPENAADTAAFFGPERNGVKWSNDGGLTWKEWAVVPDASNARILLPNGDLLFVPYRMYTCPQGVKSPYYILPKDEHVVKEYKDGFVITGWPKALGASDEQKKRGQAGWCIDGSNVVKQKDGTYLTTISGWFAPKDKGKTFGAFSNDVKTNVAAIESRDGLHWQVKAIIADENSGLPGSEGPNEAALARLKDGRLMCIFRQGCQSAKEIESKNHRYGQSFSTDEGRTWSAPSLIEPWAVQPVLASLGENGLILTGGRPDIQVWLNGDGLGKDWERIDLLAHHNEFQPTEAIVPNHDGSYGPYGMSTCNNALLALDSHTALVAYDRTPRSATPSHGRGPKDSTDPAEKFSVWIVKLTIEKTK
jgi:hypothetical protein